MGQVPMATDHGRWRPILTGGAGFPIGGRPSGTLEDVATGAWTVRPLHGALWEVGGVDEGEEKGARLCCQTAAQNTILKYCELQHCAATGGPGIFAGPSFVCEAVASCERLWKHVCWTRTTKEALFSQQENILFALGTV